jgi:thioesterase domain-containing protein
VNVDFVVNDVRLRATVVGNGAPVLLLHAGGERRTVWEPVQAALADGGFRTLAVDQRGHGESSGSRSDGLPAFAADVRELVRTAESPMVLVGSSLGGMAIILAVGDEAIGDMVRAVCLIDVVPAPDPSRAQRYLAASSDDRTGDMSRSPIAEDVLAHAQALEAATARMTMPTLLARGMASPVTVDVDVRRFVQLVPHVSVTGSAPRPGRRPARVPRPAPWPRSRLDPIPPVAHRLAARRRLVRLVFSDSAEVSAFVSNP